MCTYFEAETNAAQNLIDEFFSNFDCQKTYIFYSVFVAKNHKKIRSSNNEEKLFAAASVLYGCGYLFLL